MYTSFLNLTSKPFQLSPDPEFLFLSKEHKKALTYLKYGISSGMGGFILITGGVGVGKTTVLRTAMKNFDKQVLFARIHNTRLTSEELLSMINDDFGLNTSSKNKTALLRDLTEFLIEQYSQGRKSMLVLDEAQNFTPDVLEEIRLLSNLETDKSKLIQIILVGQPELRQNIAQPALRALRQRITVSCHIFPLMKNETEQYIYHRLAVAGNRDAVIFHDGTIELIHNFARGIPRLINVACDFILLASFGEHTREVTMNIAQEVINDLQRENRYWQDVIPESTTSNVYPLRQSIPNPDNSNEEKLPINFRQADNTKIFNKLADTERMLTSEIDRLKGELKSRNDLNAEMRFRNIKNEIEELKGITAELKNRQSLSQSKNNKKKNLWARIFHHKR